MANTIKLKRGSGSDPGTSDLVVGEIAIRTDLGKLFLKKDNGSLAEFDSSGGITDGDKGEITVSNTGDTWVVDDNIIDEANLKVSNSPTNGYFLSAQSGNTGGLTWAEVSLSTLSASNLTSGTVPTARLGSGTASSSTFLRGDNSWQAIDLTTLSASNLTSGTVAAARLDTATTQSAGNNSTKIATTAYADTAISNLVDSSPSALNTLNELAAALGDDANFSTTVTNSIATKLPLAGGTMSGAINLNSNNITNGGTITGTFVGNITGNVTGNTSGSAGSCTGTAEKATRVIVTTNSDSTSHPLFVQAATGNLTPHTSSNYTFNATSGVLSCTGFSGSGASLTNVNATTLDSIDSGSFLRSDAADTASGQLTLTYGAAYPLVIDNSEHDGKIVLQGSSNPYIQFKEGTTSKAYIQWSASGYLQIANEEAGEILRIQDGESGLKWRVGGSDRTVWTSGNDGSGSGLDADKLDGSEATKFFSSYDRTTTTGWEDNNGNFRINSGSTVAGLAMHESDGTFAFQLYGDGTYYGFLNGNWASWDIKKQLNGNMTLNNNAANIVWHAGNDGAGSGLDADTVDGFATSQSGGTNKVLVSNSSNYLVLDSWMRVGDGQGLYAAGGSHLFNGGTSTWKAWINQSTNGSASAVGMRTNQGTDRGWVYADTNYVGLLNAGGTWILRAPINDTNAPQTGGGYTLWHTANDGSGSGLDADYLDGQQGSYYSNYNNLSNKPSIPTNNNQLSNGAGYVTSAGMSSQYIDVYGSGGTADKYTAKNWATGSTSISNNTLFVVRWKWQYSYWHGNGSSTAYIDVTSVWVKNSSGNIYWVGGETGGNPPDYTNSTDFYN